MNVVALTTLSMFFFLQRMLVSQIPPYSNIDCFYFRKHCPQQFVTVSRRHIFFSPTCELISPEPAPTPPSVCIINKSRPTVTSWFERRLRSCPSASSSSVRGPEIAVVASRCWLNRCSTVSKDVPAGEPSLIAVLSFTTTKTMHINTKETNDIVLEDDGDCRAMLFFCTLKGK